MKNNVKNKILKLTIALAIVFAGVSSLAVGSTQARSKVKYPKKIATNKEALSNNKKTKTQKQFYETNETYDKEDVVLGVGPECLSVCFSPSNFQFKNKLEECPIFGLFRSKNNYDIEIEDEDGNRFRADAKKLENIYEGTRIDAVHNKYDFVMVNIAKHPYPQNLSGPQPIRTNTLDPAKDVEVGKTYTINFYPKGDDSSEPISYKVVARDFTNYFGGSLEDSIWDRNNSKISDMLTHPGKKQIDEYWKHDQELYDEIKRKEDDWNKKHGVKVIHFMKSEG